MECRVCSQSKLSLVIDLGEQPWGNHFLQEAEVGSEPFYPLQVVYCNNCQTAQLNHTVKKEVMFSNHTYLSGMTRSLSDHFLNTAKTVDETFFSDKTNKSVLDIGSNDGTQLKHYKDLGYDVLGVESSKKTVDIANSAGIRTEHAFFNLDKAKEIGKKFDVINASGVFFHLEELHSVAEGIRLCLSDSGVFVVQFIYMKKILENLAFDQIYHEHLLYYNLKTLQILLALHGLELFDAYLSPIHGGSIIGYVGHVGKRAMSLRLKELIALEEYAHVNDRKTYEQFAVDIRKMRDENRHFLENAKMHNQVVYGFGAPVKGNTLLNYFGIGKQYLQCLVEKNELRKGLYSPGMHLPIKIEKELESTPDIYYVLAWNFKKEILLNNQHLIDQGVQFYFPVNPKED